MMVRRKDSAESGQKAEEAGRPPKKRKKWLLLLALLVLLVAAAAGAVILLAPEMIPEGLQLGGLPPSASKPPGPAKSPGHTYKMEPFIVNLADTGPGRYLKIRIDLESNLPQANEEYNKRLPQLRDAVLAIVARKTSQEISGAEGKNKLREEITLRLNQGVLQFKFKTLYFTEFIIQ
jgi:flagellar protein FliL